MGPDRTVELRVHGIGGTTPAALLGVRSEWGAARVAGGGPTSFHARRADPDVEGYVWGRLSTQSPLQPLWLLLLPFTLLNVAGWAHQPAGPGRLWTSWLWLHKLVIRLLGLTLTALAVAWLALLLVDLTAWQWGRRWADRLPSGLDWLGTPGVRLGLGSLAVLILIGLATAMANRSQVGFEAVRGPVAGREAEQPPPGPPGPLEDPDFWSRDQRATSLLRLHREVALFTWAATTYLALRWALTSPSPPTLELGRLVAMLGAAQTGLLLVLLALDLAGAGGRLLGRTAAGHRWPRLRDGFRFMAPTVVATLGILVANAGGAALAQFLDGLLDLAGSSTDTVTARSELALLDVGGLTVLVLLACAGAVVAWHLPTRRRAVDALCAEEGYTLNRALPAHPVRGLPAGARQEASRDLRFARKVVRFRRLADLGRDLDLALSIPALLFLVLSAVAIWVRFEPASPADPVPLPTLDATADAIPLLPMGAEAWLRGFGAWVLVTGTGLAVIAVRLLLLRPSGRRLLGYFWDVLTFLPRRFHPLAIRPYAERAVPELQHRIAYHLHHPERPAAVLLSTHSQGTVLAAAALLSRPGFARRVGLITLGSPLAQLYARFFPAYFGGDGQFERLRARLAAANPEAGDLAWSNFFHRTDYVGKEVFGDGSDIELDDPARDPVPALPAPEAGGDPAREVWTELALHGAYWREAKVKARGRLLRERLAGPGPAVIVVPEPAAPARGEESAATTLVEPTGPAPTA